MVIYFLLNESFSMPYCLLQQTLVFFSSLFSFRKAFHVLFNALNTLSALVQAFLPDLFNTQ